MTVNQRAAGINTGIAMALDASCGCEMAAPTFPALPLPWPCSVPPACSYPLSYRAATRTARTATLGGALTFKAAIVNALTLDKYADEIEIIRVHRMQSKAQILLARGGQLTFAFSKETPDVAYGFEGVTGFYQIMGNGPFGALVKIRALLRDNEKVANEKVAPTKAPAKKRSALKKG